MGVRIGMKQVLLGYCESTLQGGKNVRKATCHFEDKKMVHVPFGT